MTDISLAEKIAAVARPLKEWPHQATRFTPGEIDALKAVLADLRARQDEVSDAFDTDDNPFHEYIRSGVLKAIEAFRADDAGRAHEALVTTARIAAAVLVEQARRAGAEEMRERAAKVVADTFDGNLPYPNECCKSFEVCTCVDKSPLRICSACHHEEH